MLARVLAIDASPAEEAHAAAWWCHGRSVQDSPFADTKTVTLLLKQLRSMPRSWADELAQSVLQQNSEAATEWTARCRRWNLLTGCVSTRRRNLGDTMNNQNTVAECQAVPLSMYLGDVELSPSELVALASGDAVHVALDQPIRVTLRCGLTPVAEGELVAKAAKFELVITQLSPLSAD